MERTFINVTGADEYEVYVLAQSTVEQEWKIMFKNSRVLNLMGEMIYFLKLQSSFVVITLS